MNNHNSTTTSSADKEHVYSENKFFDISFNEKEKIEPNTISGPCLIMITKGAIMVHEKNGNSIIRSGNIFTIHKDVEFSATFLANTDLLVLGIATNNLVLSFLQGIQMDSVHARATHANQQSINYQLCEPLYQFAQNTVSILRTGLSSSEFQELKIAELSFYLRYYYSEAIRIQLFADLVAPEITFKTKISQSFYESPTIEYIISQSGMSRTVFYRRFKEEYDMPINKWLLKQKAQKILQLLINTRCSLKDIMYQMDFASPSELNRFCKREFGVTPSQLKAKYTNKYGAAT